MHIHYDTSRLTMEQRIQLMIDAKKLCFEWYADYRDCSESYTRQNYETDFENIMSKIDEKTLFHFIRRDYDPIKQKPYLEIGFSTLHSKIEYFLWILVDTKHLKHFLSEYKIRSY